MQMHNFHMETILRVSQQEAPNRDGTLGVTSEAIDERCPGCNAQPLELCRNANTGRSTRIPHTVRTKRAERRRQGLPVDPPTIGS